MKPKELRDYILTQMSAEDALLKLLEGGLIQYEKLKFDEQKNAVHPLVIISMAAMDMGWQLAIEKDQPEVRGITVGTAEYMEFMYPTKKKKSSGKEN